MSRSMKLGLAIVLTLLSVLTVATLLGTLGRQAASASPAGVAAGGSVPLSEETELCLECHTAVTPGIVGDWRRSRHAMSTPAAALTLPESQRRMSAPEPPGGLGEVAVGCAECHTLAPESHADTFDHEGFAVHAVVTPGDCAGCHPTERAQYGQNLMSYAYGNLAANPLYAQLRRAAVGLQQFGPAVAGEAPTLTAGEPHPDSEAESCFYCHGTRVEVGPPIERDTDFGAMEFPQLTGWPNQGVGRINPDESRGSCAACHTRHQFSIAMARKPATCSECHKGPDVPAYSVYSVSKHGNLQKSLGEGWDYDAVPWEVGAHFTAPTCAVCHVSEVADENGTVLAARSHHMFDRLPYRIFGLPYAHPHPVSGDTRPIVNAAGLPLPTELTGEAVAAYVIGTEEQATRRATMQAICRACHSSGWVTGQFARLDHTIAETNAMTGTATAILLAAWEQGHAQGPAAGGEVFDEAIERRWVEQWLFFGNSTRFAAAMAGADYGGFANGRWYQSKNLREMEDWLSIRSER